MVRLNDDAMVILGSIYNSRNLMVRLNEQEANSEQDYLQQ